MAKDKIILLGGGGHARVLIDLIKDLKRYKIIGILDPKLKAGTKICNVTVLGNEDLLGELSVKGILNACIAVGSIGHSRKREKLYEKVKKEGFIVPSLIHPSAVVSGQVKVNEGVQIMAGAIVQSGTFIAENSLINTGAIVEHDSTIGKHVHICPGAVISGGCIIEDGVFIGAGTTVINGLHLGKRAVLAAGSVVVTDIRKGTIVRGVPAK